MTPEHLAYIASIIDTQGIIRSRTVGQTDLPMVAVHSGNLPMLRLLGEVTGTRVTIVDRSYSRAGCAEHCAEKHLHVTSSSGRWSVSGVKATVMLHGLRPYMRLQVDATRSGLVLGLSCPFKQGVAEKMAALGWELPEFAVVAA